MKLLDLFCGAGGCAVGYHRAGFSEIVGVDVNPQKRYPFEFICADALEFVAEHGHKFDVIHASPPCQIYSSMAFLSNGNHPDLVEPVRKVLISTGKPYIIENVPGAPLVNPLNCAVQCSAFVPYGIGYLSVSRLFGGRQRNVITSDEQRR